MPKKQPPREEGKLREDANETAYRTLQEAIAERPRTPAPGERTDSQKNPNAVERGRKGGKARRVRHSSPSRTDREQP